MTRCCRYWVLRQAPLERLENRYRYHLLLKFAPDAEPARFLAPVLAQLAPEDRARVKVDIDPFNSSDADAPCCSDSLTLCAVRRASTPAR